MGGLPFESNIVARVFCGARLSCVKQRPAMTAITAVAEANSVPPMSELRRPGGGVSGGISQHHGSRRRGLKVPSAALPASIIHFEINLAAH
jgi:hypothetical protein